MAAPETVSTVPGKLSLGTAYCRRLLVHRQLAAGTKIVSSSPRSIEEHTTLEMTVSMLH